MRHGSFQGRRNNNQNRHRGGSQGGNRPNNNGNQRPHRNQVLDSNGPEMRVRGTAHQIHEKYQALAKDAASSGDLVLAESYLQHAEHYQRIINEFEPLHQPRAEQNAESGEGEQPSVDASEAEQPTVQVVRSKRPRKQDNDDDGDLGLPSSILAAGEAANG